MARIYNDDKNPYDDLVSFISAHRITAKEESVLRQIIKDINKYENSLSSQDSINNSTK